MGILRSREQLYMISWKSWLEKTLLTQDHLVQRKLRKKTALTNAENQSVTQNQRISVKEFASSHDVSNGTISNIIHEDLELVKKSARWVPKLLSEDQKLERASTCTKSLSILDNIVAMKSMVSFHIPETQRQSEQGIGPLRPIGSWIKDQKMHIFIDHKGVM